MRRRPLLRGECYSKFGTVITSEAHLAYAFANQQNNNTAELSGIVEALQFLLPLGPVPREARVFIFSIHNMLLVYIQPRSNVRLACSGRQILLDAQLRVSFTCRIS